MMSDIDIDRFVPTPDPELLCPICHCVIHSPYETPCQHVFCKACIYTWMKRGRGATARGGNKCPSCRDFILRTELKPALPILNNLINNLKVKCINQQCPEVLAKEYLKDHEKTCGYAEVDCSNSGCTTLVMRKDAEEHKLSCRLRIVQCTSECQLPLPQYRLKGHSCTQELKQELKEQYLEAAVLREIINTCDSTRAVSRDSLRKNINWVSADFSFNRARFMSNYRHEDSSTLRISEAEILRRLVRGENPPPVNDASSDASAVAGSPHESNGENSSTYSNGRSSRASSQEYSDNNDYTDNQREYPSVHNSPLYDNESPQNQRSPAYSDWYEEQYADAVYRNNEEDFDLTYALDGSPRREETSDDNDADGSYEQDVISEEGYSYNETDDSDPNEGGSHDGNDGDENSNGNEDDGNGNDRDNENDDYENSNHQSDNDSRYGSGSSSGSDNADAVLPWCADESDGPYFSDFLESRNNGDEAVQQQQQNYQSVWFSSDDESTNHSRSSNTANPASPNRSDRYANGNERKARLSSFFIRRENNDNVRSDSSDGSDSEADQESTNAVTPDSRSMGDLSRSTDRQQAGSDSEDDTASSPNDSDKADGQMRNSTHTGVRSEETAESSSDEDTQANLSIANIFTAWCSSGVTKSEPDHSHATKKAMEESNRCEAPRDLSYRPTRRMIESSDDESSEDETVYRRQSPERSELGSVEVKNVAEHRLSGQLDIPSANGQEHFSEGSFEPDYTGQISDVEQGILEPCIATHKAVSNEVDCSEQKGTMKPPAGEAGAHTQNESVGSESRSVIRGETAPRDIQRGGGGAPRRGRLGKRRRRSNHIDIICNTKVSKRVKVAKTSGSLAERALAKRKLSESLEVHSEQRKRRKRVVDCP